MIYHTLDHKTLQWDETALELAVTAFWEEVVRRYQAQDLYTAFTNWLYSTANPLLRPTNGRVTTAIAQMPIFQAMEDLDYRLGIAQGRVGTEGTEDLVDPFEDAWISVKAAADQKGVSVPGLHGAIERGEVAARPRVAGGKQLEVSQRSVARWTPNPVRQAAGKQR